MTIVAIFCIIYPFKLQKEPDMRDLILSKIQDAIAAGDDEIEDEFGPFPDIEKLSDADLLEVFEFVVGFRG